MLYCQKSTFYLLLRRNKRKYILIMISNNNLPSPTAFFATTGLSVILNVIFYLFRHFSGLSLNLFFMCSCCFCDSTVSFLVSEWYDRVVNILNWIKRMHSALDICNLCSKSLPNTFLWFFNRLLSYFCKLLLLPYVVQMCQSVHRVIPIS